MSNVKAFVKNILAYGEVDSKNGISQEDYISKGGDSHQVSPTWVITFVRFANRDPFRTSGEAASTVRQQIVVENDCIAVSTADSKSTLTPTVSLSLLETDIDYSTAIAPGDFIFVNMLNWEVDARRVAENAAAGNPINGIDDGFKGIYKVQGVRKSITVDQSSGFKRVMYKINGYAFTEFNNTIYFNQFMLDTVDKANSLLFASYIGKNWLGLINDKGLTNVQSYIKFFVDSFIGSGVSKNGREDKNGILRSPNIHFLIPNLVGQLLGVEGATAAKDIFVYIFGIQSYSGSAGDSMAKGLNPQGLSPSNPQQTSGFWETPKICRGGTSIKPEYWNQVKTWAILNQFTNAPLNELYTAFRVSPAGSVMPTLVFRQTPFTTPSYSYGSTVTPFMSLPRWKISESLIEEVEIGRDEAARVNFVQVFGRSNLNSSGSDISQEIAAGNYLSDTGDISRSGLRPYVITSNFDDATATVLQLESPQWAKIVGDAVIGGHLKLSGTITSAGIVDPIAVGDNLEFDGVVYHIESVSHQCAVNPQTGRKTFRTSVGLSSGISVNSTNQIAYGKMTHVDARGDRDADSGHILPGVSEAQDSLARQDNIDIAAVKRSGFIQPDKSGKK